MGHISMFTSINKLTTVCKVGGADGTLVGAKLGLFVTGLCNFFVGKDDGLALGQRVGCRLGDFVGELLG